MKKSKGQTVDLLYTNKEEPKKTKRQANKKTKKTQNNNNETINLDNEIIIGLTPKKEEKNKKNKKQITNKKSKNNSNKRTKNLGADAAAQPKKNNSKINSNKRKQKNSKKTRKQKTIKWITIIALIIIAITMFMTSNVFNIKQIEVTNNNKISSEEIINLSKLEIGTNMFKITNRNINNNIKVNPYIDSVKVKRSLNGKLTLEVQERTATYMLKFGNSYVCINNQGYMLEITEIPLELPIITGFETTTEEIKEGNRLVVNDLKKLEDIIKIMESAKSNSLANIITSIDISDQSNYILTISSEGKTVQFGDTTNINIKILKIEEIMQKEKGIAGEIYFQDSEKTVFKETVKF